MMELGVEEKELMAEVQTVQALACSLSSTIPPEFVRLEPEQPGATTFRTVEVPVIDMSLTDSCGARMAEAAGEWGTLPSGEPWRSGEGRGGAAARGARVLRAAAGRQGAVRHGLPFLGEAGGLRLQAVPGQEDVDRLLLPDPGAAGHGQPRHLAHEPPGVQGGQRGVLRPHAAADAGALRAPLGGAGPGEGRHVGGVRRRRHACMVLLQKINLYPPCPEPELTLGLTPHTDLSTLTVLVPDQVQGFQVSRDGSWYDVDYVPGALLIHIGDQIEILSNGRYKAVLHRTTVSKEKTRMSWPTFVETPADQVVGPHPQLVTGENTAKYKHKRFEDYRYCKINRLPQ